jgi:hypothetical protein
MTCAGHITYMGEIRNAYSILVRKLSFLKIQKILLNDTFNFYFLLLITSLIIIVRQKFLLKVPEMIHIISMYIACHILKQKQRSLFFFFHFPT